MAQIGAWLGCLDQPKSRAGSPDYVEAVLEKEKPDAILISMGGQTALNCGIELDESGVLAKHNCRVLGTSIETVIATEDREIFKNKCLEIGEPCANSIATNTVEEALAAGEKVGYPLMARAAFALGGLGSGICQDADELRTLATKALAVSPQLLIEKSMPVWKSNFGRPTPSTRRCPRDRVGSMAW